MSRDQRIDIGNPVPPLAPVRPEVPDLRAAHAENRSLTHRAGANFSVGFRFLPKARREAVYAAYAFCRLADDAVDEGDPAGAPARLAEWEHELARAYEGGPVSAAGVALRAILPFFPIPRSAFQGLIEGCRLDLTKSRYATYDELLVYCDLVATTISTISLAIFGGLESEEARARGRDLATALQLTNIVRDVGDDLSRDRIYLPAEDLARFGVTEEELLARRGSGRFDALLRFEAARALEYFHRAEPIQRLVDEECRFAVTMMGGIYAEVASRVASEPGRTLHERVALSKAEKILSILVRLFDRRFVRQQKKK
ncbi:MAG: squalene/phytoene synthase family protein [Thermoanaerobaculia bacterium]